MKALFSLCRWLVLPVALMLAGCRSFDAVAPTGFAVYENRSLFSDEFKAITADGVRFRVREVANDPEGDARLWKTTLVKALEKKGYRIVDSTTLRTYQGRTMHLVKGQLSEADQDYLYVSGFIVDGKQIILVEAGGPLELMEHHARGLEQALKSLKVR